ncbi:hypothetical protein MARPU_15600 [Marichromatium purpuratum 984]|uniref:Uncharacterized protein n=1 Tax=Marichromatium purpuratum 984 TaxID=765910 RepID=W0E8T4_MARPU|nr:hypothetical protein [Marichromatium purpuratum]AHF05649.1 hypothetical protein MARPU_15600 [Marichromatium purpuratum 984]
MRTTSTVLGGVRILAALLMATTAQADEQAAIDGCSDRLMSVGGPDARSGGEVLNTEFSEAGILVVLLDDGGTVWRCIAYDDGTVGDLTIARGSDDGEGAMAGDGDGQGITTTERVHFHRGEDSATRTKTLSPGASIRYLLGARAEQFLSVRVTPHTASLDYQIINPDGSFLLDMTPSDRSYRGQLWQSGDHVVEVINRGSKMVPYNVTLKIE